VPSQLQPLGHANSLDLSLLFCYTRMYVLDLLQEVAVQNRIQALTEKQSRGRKREQEAPLKAIYRPFSG